MTTEATTFSGHIQKTDAGYKTFNKPSFRRRFRHFVEQSDWDEALLAQDELMDNLYIGVIIVASLYFIPHALVVLFLR